MDSAHTYLHPDFGPNLGGYPYGLTYNIVTNARRRIRLSFEYASESDPGPYPFGPASSSRAGPPYCKDAKVVLTEMQHDGLILADNGTEPTVKPGCPVG